MLGWTAQTATTLCLAVGLAACSRRSDMTPRAARDADTPPRIACASPAVTEIVYALGCGEQIVGVSTYTEFPPDARNKPCIGGWMSPNRERLLSLRPDVIISQGKNEKLGQFAAAHGITLVSVQLDSLADFFSAVATIAAELGVPAQGSALAQTVRERLDAVTRRVPPGPPERVALLLGREAGNLTGLTAVGADTFLSELLTLAGGSNIFEDAHGLYPQVARESLLVRQPRFVIELHAGTVSRDAILRAEADWQEWSRLMAVTNGAIVCVTNDFVLIPGPRMVQTAEILSGILHP